MFRSRLFSRCVLVVSTASTALVAGSSARAGAFLQPAGEGQVIAAWYFGSSSVAFNSTGLLAPATRLRSHDVSTLVEWGYDSDTTLIFKPSAWRVEQAGPPSTTAMGAGQVEAGFRRGLGRWGDAVFSLQATLSTPGQRVLAPVGQSRGQAEARLGAGAPFAFFADSAFALDGFVDLSVAYVRRGRPFLDEMRADVTLGVNYSPNILMLWQSFNIFSLERASDGSRPRLHKIQSSMVYRVTPDWSLQFGVFASVAGVASRFERGMMCAVWRKF